jgi:hypothetical protein
MPGFITVRSEGLGDDQLDGWVHEAVARAALLPPKSSFHNEALRSRR